ncbi:MAG: DUF2461 domain-containing protein [Bacteroidota bacterium]|nr:DUF2461 domain-containing protein [Bacteroidota bacterium]
MVHPDFDEQLFPPFEGFPKEGIDFLKKLKRHNNREWFNAHKSGYEDFVKFPMQSLIASLQPHFAGFAPNFELNPKRSMFRIYRDTRFSKDKTPYKTHIAAHFELRNKPKLFDGAGYYLHIAPGEVYIGGGIYMPSSDQVKIIRKYIVEHEKEFSAVIAAPVFKKMFGALSGSKLTRPPKGFPADHPLMESIKLKQFFAGVELKETLCYKKNFISTVSATCKALTPLIDFLNNALGRK